MPDEHRNLAALLASVHANRAAADDLTAELTDRRADAIRIARDAGMTWRTIGEAMGVSAQRAHEMARSVAHTDKDKEIQP